jgi:hypothetical protein
MNKRTGVAALATTSLIAMLGVVAVAAPTAGAAPPVEVPVGTVTLSTGAVDALVYDRGTAAADDDVTQPIATKAGTTCTLTPTTGPLVTWTAAGGIPSFRSDSIGTSATTLPILACAQINKSFSQSLTLTLDQSATGPFTTIFGVAFANAATLDVEVKGDDALIRLDARRAGATVGTFYLFNDSKSSKKPNLPNLTICDTSQSSYSGDLGTVDNCAWSIGGVAFDSLRITPQRGSVSLEGGGDFGEAAASRRTTIQMAVLADGAVDCEAATDPVTGEGTVTDVEVVRLPNGDAAEECAPLPFTLSTEGGSATFRKPGNTQGTSQFTLSLTRTIPATSGVPPLTVDWEDGTEVYDLPWCGDVWTPGVDGAPPTFDYGQLTAADDASAATDGIQYACQYALAPELNSDGTITIVDSVYFTGDIKFTTR